SVGPTSTPTVIPQGIQPLTLAANLDQCANGGVGNPPVPCTGSAWQNGNLNENQAHYLEGDSVPYRLRFAALATVPPPSSAPTPHTVTISWDTTQTGRHALDYLTTFDRTEGTADPCSGVADCVPAGASTFPIPVDPNVAAGPDGIQGTPDDIAQIPGVFT